MIDVNLFNCLIHNLLALRLGEMHCPRPRLTTLECYHLGAHAKEEPINLRVNSAWADIIYATLVARFVTLFRSGVCAHECESGSRA